MMTMSPFLWCALSLIPGWVLCDQIDNIASFHDKYRRALFDSKNLPSWVYIIVNVFALFFGVCLLVIAIAQAREREWGFSAEEIFSQKPFLVLASFFVGFCARLYKGKLIQFLGLLAGIFRGDDKLPILIQSAIVFAFVASIILLSNPGLLKNMTSFKAGEIEANFKDDASKISLSNMLIGLKQAVALRIWQKFDMAYGSYYSNIMTKPSDRSKQRENAWRRLSYALSHESPKRIEFANSIFYRQFDGLFALGSCYQENNEIEKLRSNKDLKFYVQDYAQLIRTTTQVLTGDNEILEKRIKSQIYSLYRRSLDIQIKAFFELMNEPIVPKCINNYTLFPEDPQDFKKILSETPLSDLWEPYIVSAVSDFISITQDDNAKADFLEDFRSKQIINGGLCLPRCDFEPIGETSLYRYLVLSKLDSDDIWPINAQIRDLRQMLANVDQYIASDDDLLNDQLKSAGVGTSESELLDLKQHYRVIELQDLALGLEVLYKKALLGNKFDALNKNYWQLWLTRTSRILSAAEGVGLIPGMEAAEISKWQAVAPQLTSDTLFDAATAVSLSAILLPMQAGTPNSADCQASRAFALFAKQVAPQVPDKLAQNALAHIKGYANEVNDLIETVCTN